VSGSVTMFLNPSLQTKSTDSYAAVRNIEPEITYIAPENGQAPISGAHCGR
jgi:hypothetical protein